MDFLLDDGKYCGNNITVINRDENCTLYLMEDDVGKGIMTCYMVFPGIYLMYNEFHMGHCLSKFKSKVRMIGIDHCRQGRIEWEFEKNTFIYLREGDLQIDGKERYGDNFVFPLNHYYGITVAVNLEEAEDMVSNIFNSFSIDLKLLYEKFCNTDKPFILRGKAFVEHIFSELYCVPDKIKYDYFKIKVLELLIYLNSVNISEEGKKDLYFTKNQVDSVKKIMGFITNNLDRRFTLQDLSEKFEIPLTSMKMCFKGVYGTSIYNYLRNYRINAAAIMLKNTDDNITTIAGKVGYGNPSKFTAAFKEIMGICPGRYRKKTSDWNIIRPEGVD